MKIPGMSPVLGALRILRRRVAEVGQPGLALWANAGEKAATDVRAGVTAAAHAAEVYDAEAERLLEDAKKDGLDASDTPAIDEALRHLRRSRELDRQIGEAVQS